MRQDLATKSLEEYPDVFADIINVNLYGGKQIIFPEDLQKLPSKMIYRTLEGELRELDSDIRMKVCKEGRELAVVCIENQSGICNTMPVRDMGYCYAGYKEQIRQIKEENRKGGMHYYTKEIRDGQKLIPVISLVLYFGKGEWVGPISLIEVLDIQEEEKELIEPFVQDRCLRLIDLGRQDEKTRSKYRSDFRHVVDYLVCRREKQKLKYFMKDATRGLSHPEEFLDVIGAVGSDARYRDIKETIRSRIRKGEEVNMCIIAEELENIGLRKGLEKGDMLRLIRQTLKKQKKGFSVSEIADMLEEEEVRIHQILLAVAEAGTEDIESVYECLDD